MRNLSKRLLSLINQYADGKHTKFARSAGIPPSTFQAYLKDRMPHADHLVRIRETFGVSIDWILTGDGSPAIRHSDGINIELLKIIIAAIEKGLNSRDLELEPDKKAEAIALLYELYADSEKQIDENTVGRYLRLVAA